MSPAPSPASLVSAVAGRRVVVCVGPGGVGKTTVAAGIAVALAQSGQRVLALTIDPARRLADSMGVTRNTGEAVNVVDPALGVSAEQGGQLWVAMLDAKTMFDSLVARYAPDEKLRDRILGNNLYLQLSSYLAGTQEYMAMERLLEAYGEQAYDVIVLDTPPTQHAIDFFEAPDRMIEALDGSLLRWIVNGLDPDRGASLNLLARGVARALQSVARITGVAFLEQTAALLTDLNALFGGVRKRASRVKEFLRSEDLTCVLVTRPEPLAVRDAEFLSDYLVAERIGLGAWVFNRSESFREVNVSTEAVTAALAVRGVPDVAGTAASVWAVLKEAALIHAHEDDVLRGARCSVPQVRVPPFHSRSEERTDAGSDERACIREMARSLRQAPLGT